ncbi:D-alanyl-D-alanine carboxypeptidase family protein [Kyrpidia tusciae]|uniref:Peptidase S11 D-alanyl-D-alanine carboxypeptidase 1 n=1 Tax=Kyrpidia tusciae (strain DSM 2912 / NBRC 15312 / T2) TaxID=562970 RepID=D5WQA8_KYRT2|nr:D-alanyl-D-alanine carboxypeptidase family protein [Kyrpidia tusciae]ADG06517.1 peptidase S11 D-alanyl-D-alanine carboxypeptidase 1 [Kyrpidia tusciae DSM 2912]
MAGRVLAGFVAVTMILFPGVGAAAANSPDLYGISAQGAAVVDVGSGRVLYEKNGDQMMPIASLTKIVTGWLAVESGRLDERVTISANAARKEGSSVYLRAGETYTLRDLVYAMMLRSGNDAATAVAEHLAGSEARFAALMNAKAREMGLRHVHFANPHGLDAPGHGASAVDLARMTAKALQNPEFAAVVRTKYHRMPWPGEAWDRVMRNKNKMLWRYPGADGVKTGYTKRAGRCLASSATRDGHQVVVVVLKDPDDWADTARLFDHVFQTYEWVPVQAGPASVPVRGGVVPTVPVRVQGPDRFPIRADEKFHMDWELKPRLRAPVSRGEPVGLLRIQVGEEVHRYSIVAMQPVDPRPWWDLRRLWM